MSYQGWSDFRSDTVTRPTPAMRRAMAEAEVGDDVFGDDPTINRLQELAAGKLGKEAALFVPSGTMGNSICLKAHGSREKEIILEEKSHIFNFEAGNVAHLVQAIPRPLPSDRGQIAVEEIRRHICQGDDHAAATAGICLENTHNFHGGATLSQAYIQEVARLAKAHHLYLHLDGARIFNAATYLKVAASDVARPFDSLMFCLSKGLAAPVGSLVVGSREFIREAHRVRKYLGGGMRQAGILAAAGIIALEEMTGRLEEDHRRARRLAAAVSEFPGIRIDPATVQTNIVILTVDHPRLNEDEIVKRLEEERVLALTFGSGRIRLVTHNDIDDGDVDRAVSALLAAVSG